MPLAAGVHACTSSQAVPVAIMQAAVAQGMDSALFMCVWLLVTTCFFDSVLRVDVQLVWTW